MNRRDHAELHALILAAYVGGLVYFAVSLLLCAGLEIARKVGLTLPEGVLDALSDKFTG